MIEAVSTHIWQSTVVAASIALLAVAFSGNRARVRHALWFVASLKFLIPFAPLMLLGAHLQSSRAASEPLTVVAAMARFGQPLLEAPLSVTTAVPTVSWTTSPVTMLAMLWATGLIGVVCLRLRTWLRIRAAISLGTRVAMPNLDLPTDVNIVTVPTLLEPAVVGIWRPTLLLPENIETHLTPEQLETVVAHELCHVRRRDNLTAAIHMCVEAIFWFHPAVWLIGARLIDERERACDEDVVMTTATPEVYAEAILNVCKRYAAAASPAVAGVSGANLRARIEAILIEPVGRGLNTRRRTVLAAAAFLALALPVATGAMRAGAEQITPTLGGPDDPSFEVVSIKRNTSGSEDIFINRSSGSFAVNTTNVAMRGMIMRAFQVKNLADAPEWIDSERYDVLAKASGKPTPEEVNGMLRTMFRTRFKLAAHIEPRQIPVYELVVARANHPGLKRFTGDCDRILVERETAARSGQGSTASGSNVAPPCGYTWSATFNSGGITMRTFAGLLDFVAGRVVVDRTNLPGRYEFNVRFAQPQGRSGAGGPDDSPDFSTALQEQLGLWLKAARAPVDTLVIDHVEQPTPN